MVENFIGGFDFTKKKNLGMSTLFFLKGEGVFHIWLSVKMERTESKHISVRPQLNKHK